MLNYTVVGLGEGTLVHVSLSLQEKKISFYFFFFFSQREKFPSFSKTFIEDLLYFVRGGPENTGKDMVCVITDL